MLELWRNPWVRLVVAGLAFLALAWLVAALSDILVPLMLALIFAYIFDPVVDFFEAHKLSRGAGIIVILGTALLLVAGFGVYVVPSMVGEVAELTETVREKLPEWQAALEARAEAYQDHPLAGVAQERATDALEWLRSKVPDLLAYAQAIGLGAFRGILSGIGFLTNTILFAIVAVYLLYDFDPLVARLRDLVPHPYRARTFDVAGRINENVRNFFRGQIVVCTILTAIYTAGLMLFDVPFAPLLGVIGGFGQLIPYVGTLLGAIPAVLLAAIEHQSFVAVGGAAGTFVVGQMLEGMVITPKIVGDKVGLHPVVVILALMVFTKAFGFIGLLLAVPLAAALKVLIGEAVTEYRASAFFGAPAAAPAAAGDAAAAETPPSES